MSQYLWGIDLGGTKIECAVLDSSQQLKPICRKRVPTGADQGYGHIIGQVKKLVDMVATETGLQPHKIGFSTPGVLDPSTQTMKNCNTVCMNGQAMKKDLEATLGVPTSLANDANCFALAETLMGAVPQTDPQARVVFGVIMGTGVGGGVVVDGKVIYGKHGIGGEWGHNFCDESGGACYCGKSGCNEKVFAGPALERFYAEHAGETRYLPEIVERHKQGIDPVATQTIERLLTMYAKSISAIINVLDPDVIVLGGGVGNIDLLYTEGYERIKRYIFNSGRLETPIVRPALGDSAGVFGAALL
jgi:fructokinase